MRARYETGRDLINEIEIVTALLPGWRLSGFQKNPDSYGPDFSLIRQQRTVVAFCEAKNRPKLPFGFRDGYYLSLQKVIRGHQMTSESGGLPCMLAVRFEDGRIGTTNFNKHLMGCIIAGRTDRNDPKDVEPHVVFPWDAFEVVQ